ncbi:hypothetical protein D3C87_1726420 [compost metagenome]
MEFWATVSTSSFILDFAPSRSVTPNSAKASWIAAPTSFWPLRVAVVLRSFLRAPFRPVTASTRPFSDGLMTFLPPSPSV